MEQLYISRLECPIGTITIVGTDTHVTKATFQEINMEFPENAVTRSASNEFSDYFNGKATGFSFPIQQHGTAFQQEVWRRLINIPYGTTTSYAAFSTHAPLAIRAIAAANGKNDVAIAVPCHRVIGSSGKLVGYAGGLWRKKWLIEYEREVLGLGQSVMKF